ncbi:MAG: DUF1565 domain-containing protein [Verrucomicrobia bacterium]|nr:MAG: DUF1565 domain-containing protein [Verrucomicrobiota bacterium]
MGAPSIPTRQQRMKKVFILGLTLGVTGGFLPRLQAAVLAYEPFTNTTGAAIIGSSDGYGFNGAWQTNSSAGTATNTGFGLSYTDAASNTLVTVGGAGFFQGYTLTNGSMQPIRLFNFSRGTNGTDGVTTWISFLIARQGPTGTLAGNPYGRGANLPHDFNAGAIQKLAIGNSSGATSNTVGLIPTGSATNLKGATNQFGGATNFIVVRIDHVAGAANDNAWLFVNPQLNVEPSTNSAGAVSANAFDFSFDRLRVFAGGTNSSTTPPQPYAELVVDEYRIGEAYADVTPYAGSSNPPAATGPLIITNRVLLPGAIILAGTGGSNGATYYVLTATNISLPVTNWPAVGTNTFDAAGRFNSTNPTTPGAVQQYFRLLTGGAPPSALVAPNITTQPTNRTVTVGQPATFNAAASGSATLRYQWYFNNGTPLANATNATLAIASAQTNDAGNYYVIVSNSVGAATSAVALLTVNQFPVITAQPTNQTVSVSNNASFVVTAIGTAALRYQWYFNTNTPLANATNASLALNSVQSNNAGAYRVIVTNDFGAATSSIATLTVTGPLVAGAYFVSVTNGNDSNAGTEASPFKTISKGLSVTTTGGVVYVRAGTYALSSKLSLSGTGGSAVNSKRLWAYPGEFPVIDSTGNSSDGIGISGRFYHLKGLTVMNAGHNGINISGNSNIVEFCTLRENGNTGLHITGSTDGVTYPAANLILNCDSYLNYDPPIGGNADGFSAKWQLGPGNVFRGCRAWWNSDDGWDLWMGTSPVLMDNCWAFWNGTNYWADPQFNGNGNGFKLGGNYVGTPHRLAHSLAFVNESNGVDQNNNEEGQTIDNNTSWGNKARNFNLNHGTNSTPHLVRNNLSFSGASGDSFRTGTIVTSNSWQVVSSPAANAGDVLSVNSSGVDGPRQSDGSLPVLPFLRPVPAGRLIDKGVDVGDPFAGAAPDLGAFEDGL